MAARKAPDPVPRLRPDGRWWIREELPHVVGQRRRRASIYGATPEECLAAWRARDRSVRSGDRAPERGQPLEEILAAWLDWLEPAGPEHRLRRTSWIGYETHIRKHIVPWLGRVRVTELTVGQVEDWLVSLQHEGRSAPMRRKVLTTLRSALKWAGPRLGVQLTAASAAGLPKADRAKKWKAPPSSEVDAILAAIAKHRLRAHFLIALTLGPRMGELNGLWWDEVDREARTIELAHTLAWPSGGMIREDSKTVAGQRTIRLPDSVWDVLMEWEERQAAERAAAGAAWRGKPDEPYVFTRSTGTPLRGDGSGGAGAQWKACLRRAGLSPRNFHQTRHISASVLLALNGNNLVEVGQVLGHSTYRFTIDRYAHLGPDASRTIAAKLDEFYAARAALGVSNGVSNGVSG